MGVGRGAVVLLGLLAAGAVCAQSADVARGSDAARRIVDTMLAHEGDPAEHRNKYMYLSEERSERTGGHLWTERVVETAAGEVGGVPAAEGKTRCAGRGGGRGEQGAGGVWCSWKFSKR